MEISSEKVGRAVFTSDLHGGITGMNALTTLRDRILDGGQPDVFAILGDVADGGLENFSAVLRIFKDVGKNNFLIPGNHDLYNYSGEKSEDLYRGLLKNLSSKYGFKYGMNKFVLGDTTFIFNSGWHNGTFRAPNTMFHDKQVDDDYFIYMLDGRKIDIDYHTLHAEQMEAFVRHTSEINTKSCVIASHYPLFSELYVPYNLVPKPSDAYFYSPEFGEHIKTMHDRNVRNKTIDCIAGHVHRGMVKTISSGEHGTNRVNCVIIDADYKKPKFHEMTFGL